jgi:peptidoglycan/xylan/chitin deacetylase (PgdA/CDA1 family)
MQFKIWKAGLVLLFVVVWSTFDINAAIPIQPEEKIKNIFIPVLCYHRIIPKVLSVYDLTPGMLEKQLRFFLAQGYQPITALQYLKLQKYPQFFPDKPIMLTFDDGNKSHFRYVFPLLQKYNIKATFFVYLNTVATKSDKLIIWDELMKMSRAGMDIESHTMSHPYLTKSAEKLDNPRYLAWLDHELKDSRRIIEEHLKTKVVSLAYSFGWFNSVVEAKAVEAGYQGIFTVNWGVNRAAENPLRLKRRVVSNKMNQVELQRYISSKPLSLEIISPTDAAIISRIPVVRFKLADRELNMLDIVVGKNKGVMTPDREGNFSFILSSLHPNYNIIIVSGYNDQKQLFIGSWGFDYKPPVMARNNTPTTKGK